MADLTSLFSTCFQKRVFFKIPCVATTDRACCCAEILYRPAHNYSPIKFIKVQITNKSSKEIRHPKLLLIVNKKIRIIRLPV
jgi:hypothetical protein